MISASVKFKWNKITREIVTANSTNIKNVQFNHIFEYK